MKKKLLVVLIFSMIFLCYCTMAFAQVIIELYKDKEDPNTIQILLDWENVEHFAPTALHFPEFHNFLILGEAFGSFVVNGIWDPTTADFVQPSYYRDLGTPIYWSHVAVKDKQVFYVKGWETSTLSLHRVTNAVEDKDFLAVSYGKVLIFDPVRGTIRVKLSNSSDEVISEINTGWFIQSLALSPDMKYMAARSGAISNIYFCATGEKAVTIKESGPTVRLHRSLIAFSPDSKYYAYIALPESDISGSASVVLIDTSDWKEAARFSISGFSVTSFAFSNDGQYLATGDNKPEIIIWDIASKKAIHRLKNPFMEYRRGYDSIAISPDNRYVVASCDFTVNVTLRSRGYGSLSYGFLEFWNMQNDEFLFLMDRRGEDYIALFSPTRFYASEGAKKYIYISSDLIKYPLAEFEKLFPQKLEGIMVSQNEMINIFAKE